MASARERAEAALKRARHVFVDKDFEFKDKICERPGIGLAIIGAIEGAIKAERERCAKLAEVAGCKELKALIEAGDVMATVPGK